jgi:hypothetical protein
MRFRRYRMTRKAYDTWKANPKLSAESVLKLQQECEQAAYVERGGLLIELNRLRGGAPMSLVKEIGLRFQGEAGRMAGWLICCGMTSRASSTLI